MYKDLFKENRSILFFGLLLTFFSSFGQTFLISLYLPALVRDFDLTLAGIGSLYGLITIASAFLLTFAGKFIDTMSLRHYALWSILLMTASLLVMGMAQNFFVMVLGFLGLRFAGQGLLPHTSITTMARYFDKMRGKAMSVATLGHPIGEAVFPVLVAIAISTWGWRQALYASAVVLAVGLLPYLLLVIRRKEKKARPVAVSGGPTWTQWQVLKSKPFWQMAPNVFLLPMVTTAFFFYQVPLAESKGWPVEWIAMAFTGFALASSTSMVVSGWMIDRFSARKLFPFYLLPLLLALLLLRYFPGKWVAFGYLILTGIAVGFGSTIKSAVQVELFGVQSIGAVRSLFSTLIVLSTAFGPAIFGWSLGLGFTFNQMIVGTVVLLLVIMVQSFRILPAFAYKRAAIQIRRKLH